MIIFDNKTIVVTFLMHLGDLMLTTPFLHMLRKAAPNSRIIFVVDKKLEDLVKYNPNVDEVIGIDKKGKDKSVPAIWRFGRMIHRNYQPDMVINLHKNERTSFLALAIGAKEYVGASHALFKPFMKKYIPLQRSKLHAAAMYKDVLTKMGVEDSADNGLEMVTAPEWDLAAENFYKEQGVSAEDVLIGFNIGSAVPEKRWDSDRFARVAMNLMDEGYKVIFFGGPMDVEMVDETIALMGENYHPIIATGKFKLGPLAALLRRCRLLITNDSGPMHMAVSQRVPLVTLYGPSNPKFYGPYCDNAIVLQSTTAYDEGKSMKEIIRSGDYEGLNAISVEAVLTAVHHQLQSE